MSPLRYQTRMGQVTLDLSHKFLGLDNFGLSCQQDKIMPIKDNFNTYYYVLNLTQRPSKIQSLSKMQFSIFEIFIANYFGHGA